LTGLDQHGVEFAVVKLQYVRRGLDHLGVVLGRTRHGDKKDL
jgi:hypothetical protein